MLIRCLLLQSIQWTFLEKMGRNTARAGGGCE